MNDPITIALLVGVLIPSVVLHEVAHGLVARAFGDPTAAEAGRLTLNPIRHVDPFGTLILPLMLAATSFGVFGYAKPVPVDPRRLRDPRRQALWVALAGPATNICLALAAAVPLRLILAGDPSITPHSPAEILLLFGVVNAVLAAFNLLPVPPLDGSALIERFLPVTLWRQWLSIRRFGFGIVLILVLVVPGGLSFVFDPAIDAFLGLLS